MSGEDEGIVHIDQSSVDRISLDCCDTMDHDHVLILKSSPLGDGSSSSWSQFIASWLTMDHPSKMDDFGGPLCLRNFLILRGHAL